MKIRLRVPAVDDPDFVADVAHGEVSVLRLVGSADSAAQAPLDSLLTSLHAELLARLKVQEELMAKLLAEIALINVVDVFA